ncbi:hypothetical protein IWX58_003409 [Rubrivivax gelatinosus]|jgi:hypothetical protein|uniref:Uncharacterized protein n=1 Tax=Rubrivivax gelatinosus (strain NBRC 100245 / IL144) TaxID=983917 RepID=I0HQ88_RUBGI|nr:hypothetical protein [Rubrivivax gelatinosus]BAL95175.1 hypothetical protein RGE_18340 [Rubrivivax gelatinosus IL144]
MRHETAVAKETELRQLDRLAMLASAAIALVPLLPYALNL